MFAGIVYPNPFENDPILFSPCCAPVLCGLGCGAFYAVCLLAATLLANGRLDWQGSNAMLPLALLLGGLLGGALTALRAGR